VLQHGNTFGPDAKTKWRIEHTRSQVAKGEDGKGVPVIRVHVK
jgi:hypothetical protein